MKKNINVLEYRASNHAIQRLNERFNVTKDESGKWVRRFLNEAVELDEDTGDPNCKYFKKDQCVAVVNKSQKLIITVYQKTPTKDLHGFKTNLSAYIRPFAKKIGRKYTHDLNNHFYILASKLIASIIQMQFPSKKFQCLEQIKKISIEIEQNATDAIDDLKTLKRF